MSTSDSFGRSKTRRECGFTLLEILVTVVIMGIAGALVIPAMGETGVLRVQGAVRSIVADMTFAQADAVAFQERRALIFDVASNTYRLVQVPGDTLDPVNNTLYDPTKPDGRYVMSLADARFGNSRLVSASFDNEPYLIFDAMGGPVADASGSVPGTGGRVQICGSRQTFTIAVEPFTGRVTVTRQDGEIEPETPIVNGGG
jgi:prepilin-type N-terminal cleavage/methylation domain-containing protein